MKHQIKNLYRRLRYGAGCCDIYSLYYFMARRIGRWLRLFKEQRKDFPSYPSELSSPEEWETVLDEMIWAFDFYSKDVWHEDPKEEAKMEARAQKGVELFGKYFRDLWN